MALRCKFEELDDQTRDYLHEVRSRKGSGTPGIFVPGSNSKPVWALLVGPLLALIMLYWSWGSPKNPWAVAALQTAAILGGGWSVAYALRRWFSADSPHYGGYFTYFDPLNAYQVQGEKVVVTRLQKLRGVEADGNQVFLDLGSHGEATIPVRNAGDAQLVEDYYDAMDRLERDEEGPWSQASAAELGAAARMSAEEDEVPRKAASLDLDLDKVPEDPERANRPGFGFLPLLVILGGSAAVFVGLGLVNKPIGDNLAFKEAKEQGAPGLRAYLLNDRNTRNREEAKKLIAQAYDAPVNKIKSAPAPKNRQLRDGMVQLVESLRGPDAPVVSISVQPKQPEAAPPADPGGGIIPAPRPQNPPVGGPGAVPPPEVPSTQLRQDVADGLARSIGTSLVAFAEPAEGTPAHLTIRYHFVPDRNGWSHSAIVEVEIRTAPDSPPVASGSFTAIDGAQGIAGPTLGDALKQAICVELVGEYQPAPPPAFGGGDF